MIPDSRSPIPGPGPRPSIPVSAFRYRRRVQFAEVDSARIVHFSRYFRYMEEAEHALWRSAGISIAPPDATVGWARVGASFDYQAPLRFEDEFDVDIRIARIGGRSIRYDCVVSRDGDRIATGSMTVVCVTLAEDGRMVSIPIPPEIAAHFTVAAGVAS